MKKRTGFVSNSSSSSFILKNENELEEFKKAHPDYEAGVRKAWEKVKAEGGYKPNAAPVTDDTPQAAE